MGGKKEGPRPSHEGRGPLGPVVSRRLAELHRHLRGIHVPCDVADLRMRARSFVHRAGGLDEFCCFGRRVVVVDERHGVDAAGLDAGR